MEFGQKKFFREINLFDFTNFLGLDFSNVSGPLWWNHVLNIKRYQFLNRRGDGCGNGTWSLDVTCEEARASDKLLKILFLRRFFFKS